MSLREKLNLIKSQCQTSGIGHATLEPNRNDRLLRDLVDCLLEHIGDHAGQGQNTTGPMTARDEVQRQPRADNDVTRKGKRQ